MMDSLFLFVTTALPKAGAQLGAVPLTLNLVLLATIIMRSPSRAFAALGAFRAYRSCYAILLGLGFFGTVFALVDGLSVYALAQRLIVMVSPLAAVAAVRIPAHRGAKIVAVSMLVTSVYALIQFIAGVTGSSVAGITYTYGQELAFKPIGYTSLGDTAKKMPSTFQNGNSFGIFAALAVMLMLTWRPNTSGLRKLRAFALAGGVLGLLLCGSRSIIIPVVLSLGFVIHRHLVTLSRRAHQRAVVMIIGVCLGGVLYLSLFRSDIVTSFWQRNAVQTMNDPTATGRTGQWQAIGAGITELDGWQYLRLILIGQDPSWGMGGEGLPAFFVTFGLVATIAFYGGLLVVARACWRHPTTRPVALGVLCVVFAFAVDQSYFYPPNLMNLFLVAVLALRLVSVEAGGIPASSLNPPSMG